MAQERVLEPLDDDEREALSALLNRVVHHHSGLVSFGPDPAGPVGATPADMLSDRAGAARPTGGS